MAKSTSALAHATHLGIADAGAPNGVFALQRRADIVKVLAVHVERFIGHPFALAVSQNGAGVYLVVLGGIVCAGSARCSEVFLL